MSEVKSREKHLTPLLQRAIMDDGPEAANAFYLFKEKLRKHGMDGGSIYYLDEEMHNPMLYVVWAKDAEIAQLREQLDEAYEVINRETATAKAPAFPWSEFPEQELTMCRDFASKKGSAPSFVNRWIGILSKASGKEVREGSIKQRLGNNTPPSALINEPLPLGSTTSWLELWLLGSFIEKRSWKDVLFKRLNLPNRDVGSAIRDIEIKEIDDLRREFAAVVSERGRSNGETLQWAARKVFEAGPSGITRKGLLDLDRANKDNISKRINDLVKNRVIFRLSTKVLVHRDFNDQYKDEWEITQSALDRRASSLLAAMS